MTSPTSQKQQKCSTLLFLCVYFLSFFLYAHLQLTVAGTAICSVLVQHLIQWNLSLLSRCYCKADKYLQPAARAAFRQRSTENENKIQGKAECLQFSSTPAQAVVAQQLSASLRIYSAACLLLPPVCDARKAAEWLQTTAPSHFSPRCWVSGWKLAGSPLPCSRGCRSGNKNKTWSWIYF